MWRSSSAINSSFKDANVCLVIGGSHYSLKLVLINEDLQVRLIVHTLSPFTHLQTPMTAWPHVDEHPGSHSQRAVCWAPFVVSHGRLQTRVCISFSGVALSSTLWWSCVACFKLSDHGCVVFAIKIHTTLGLLFHICVNEGINWIAQ